MQSDSKEIYKLTSLRTQKDEILYKHIGDFIFSEVHRHLEKPQSLITRLKGVGFWFLKRKRIIETLNCYPIYYEIEGYKDFSSEHGLLRFVKKQELYNILKERLKDYDKYLEKRALYKIKKDEFDKVYEGKKNSIETSED